MNIRAGHNTVMSTGAHANLGMTVTNTFLNKGYSVIATVIVPSTLDTELNRKSMPYAKPDNRVSRILSWSYPLRSWSVYQEGSQRKCLSELILSRDCVRPEIKKAKTPNPITYKISF